MKISNIPLVALVAATFAALPSSAQQFEKSEKIIGMVITDGHNQRVGKVGELAVDLQAGRIAEVLVDTGGFLTSNHRIVAVPPESFAFAGLKDGLFLSADLDAFDGAPAFDMSSWMESTRRSSVTDVYKRFHVQPYAGMSYVEKASKIAGMSVRNQQNERLGDVETLVVSLPGGQIPDVMIGSTGFPGLKGQWTAVPPLAFILDTANNILVLETTRDAFKNAPHFKPGEWKNAVNGSLSASAGSSGGTEGDAAITLEIQHKILIADGLSLDAREVQVITRQGRVTLHGTADSEKEKQQLGLIAASVVPADHVDNQIEVKLYALATTY